MSIESWNVKDLSHLLRSKEVSSKEVCEQYLKSSQDQNDRLNVFVELYDDALAQAEAIDARRAKGEELPDLAGVPVGLKDNIVVQGKKATAGSLMLENYTASYDATVVERMKAEGMVLVGRTNMDEFAMGSSTEASHYGATKNPWDDTKIPGGSSGGSVAAVAADMVPVSLGSDTGGSVRQPAALCGVTGLKPTYGRVSRYGLMSLGSSLDQISPCARTVEDVAMMMRVIEGKDARDANSAVLDETSLPELGGQDLRGVRLGVPKEYFIEGIDAGVKAAVDEGIKQLEAAGAEIHEVSLPHAEYAIATYYVIMPSEASSNLGRYDGIRYGYQSQDGTLMGTYEKSRGEGFGSEVQRRIMIGAFALSAGYYDAYYKKALQVRALIKKDFDEVFKKVDALVTPTSPFTAWDIGAKFNDPLAMYLSDIYTVSANLATVPALSVPCGFSNGLPVGMQLIAKPFDESMLYRIGMQYQSLTDWHTRRPGV